MKFLTNWMIWKKYGGIAAFLVVVEFFLSFSFFMFVPFISIYVTGSLGYTLTFAGALLALRLIGQQGFMLFGGYFGDKFGHRRMIFIGLLCRGIGFAGIGLVSSPVLLLTMATIGGLGGALFSPALRSLLVYNQPKEHHKELYSYINITGNAGTIIGPLFGTLFSVSQFSFLSITSGISFIAIGIIFWFFPINRFETPKDIGFQSGLWSILKNRQFLFVIATMIPFHFIYQQLFLTFPIVATAYTNGSGWIFTFVTALIVLFQGKVTRATKIISVDSCLQIGYVSIAVTLLPLVFWEGTITLIISLIGLSFAIMLLLPTFYSYTVDQASSTTLGIFIGFSNLAMAIGGALGNTLGGKMYDVLTTSYYWMMLLFISLLALLALMGKSKFYPFK